MWPGGYGIWHVSVRLLLRWAGANYDAAQTIAEAAVGVDSGGLRMKSCPHFPRSTLSQSTSTKPFWATLRWGIWGALPFCFGSDKVLVP